MKPTTTKRARQTPQEIARKGQDPFSCVRSRKRVSKKRGKHKEEKWREIISTLETAKREASNRNNASEPEKSTTFLRQIHFPKSHEE